MHIERIALLKYHLASPYTIQHLSYIYTLPNRYTLYIFFIFHISFWKTNKQTNKQKPNKNTNKNKNKTKTLSRTITFMHDIINNNEIYTMFHIDILIAFMSVRHLAQKPSIFCTNFPSVLSIFSTTIHTTGTIVTQSGIAFRNA